MPTGNENLLGALIQGLLYCWNESIGYSQTTRELNPNVDCSSFVWYCLHNNGFDVGPSPFDTTSEYGWLVHAGFTPYVWGVDINTPQHGDIFMYDEGGGDFGHTFFYAENVYCYTDPTGRTATKGVVQHAKIEASSSRKRGYQYPNDPDTQPGDVNNPDQDGDYPRNGVGAYWEVWAHAYAGNDPTTGSHTWYVFRWGGTPPGPIPPTPTSWNWLLKKIRDRNHHDSLNTLDQLFI